MRYRKLVIRPTLTGLLCAPSLLTASFLAVTITNTAQAGTVIEPQPKMGEPVNGLDAGQLDRFIKGKEQFTRVFQDEEGLGPIMNQQSCGSCHNNPVGGPGVSFVTRFGMQGKGGFDPLESLGGSLLQSLTITPGCGEVVPEGAFTAHRITSSALGIGLIEAIDDADLQANADFPPRGVSGRVHMVQPLEDPLGPERVGRFGWKSQVATVLSFSGDAALNEMGITNYLVGTENAPNGDDDLLAACDTVADPEDVVDGEGIFFIERVTDFQRYLAAPPQTPRSGMPGEDHFNMLGCNKCHVASFTTASPVGLEPFLANQVIKPYSDFLCHDMGQNADFIEQGPIGGTEIKTPPLWGLLTRDPLWHDGRFEAGTFETRVRDAIAAHFSPGSEANATVKDYNKLDKVEQDELIAFLASLGRAEFDSDADNVIDLIDFHDFVDCYGGTDYEPDDPCAIHDIDQDGDVDLDDFDSFLLAYDDVLFDCNENAVADLEEILLGAADKDMNGFLDECILLPCATDIVGSDFQPPSDGEVDGSDLAFLLGEWGVNPGSLADFVTSATFQPPPDGMVDGADLAVLLGQWGVCD